MYNVEDEYSKLSKNITEGKDQHTVVKPDYLETKQRIKLYINIK